MKMSEALRQAADNAIERGQVALRAKATHATIAHYHAAAIALVIVDFAAIAERGEISDFPAANNIDNLG